MNTNIPHNNANRIRSVVDLNPLRGKKVLITGSSGLIGGTLVAALDGIAAVTAIYHSSIGFPTKTETVRFIRQDLTGGIGGMFDNFFDYIIHAAGYASPSKFMGSLNAITLNTSVTADIANRYLKAGGTMLYLSSSEIYSGLTHRAHESEVGTTTPDHPRALYIEGKRSGEAVCHMLRGRGIDVRIARVSSVYGPGAQLGDTRVVNRFAETAARGKTIKMVDGGSAVRTYLYVSDAVTMLLNVMLYGKRPTYNVGSEDSKPIWWIADAISKLGEVAVEYARDDIPVLGSPKTSAVDMSLYADDFEIYPQVPLLMGLAETVGWYRALLADY